MVGVAVLAGMVTGAEIVAGDVVDVAVLLLVDWSVGLWVAP